MKILLTIVSLFFSLLDFAQHDDHNIFHPHHALGLIISHTQVSQGVQANGNKKWLSLPSWGVNYNYKFSKKWAIGLHNDIVVEDFAVEDYLKSGSNNILQRSYPIATALMASFKPGNNFSYLFGAGGEFAHTGSFFLMRLGVEYSYHLNRKWELNAMVTNDLKINAYNSWAIGMGISRLF